VATSTPAKRRPSAREVREAADRRKRRRTLVLTVLASLTALAAVALLAFGGGTASPAYSTEREAFALPALTGHGDVRLADHKGTPVVVNFFASWCVYCNQELPGFTEVARATKGKVAFIGVDTNDTGDGAAMARRFDLAGAGFQLARDVGAPPASQLWSSFGGQGLPVTAFYDSHGKLVDFAGGMLTQPELEARIAKLYGVAVKATDAATQAAPVIPVIPQGAFELLRTHADDPTYHALDVRTAAEFGSGHVPGAANLDVTAQDFATKVGSLDRDQTYIVYCHSGNRSARATEIMHQMGFKHVYDVQGGIAAWQAAQLPLQQ
jgi:rhodanese-related sulfurtransferase